LLFVDLGSDDEHLYSYLKYSSVYRKEW